MHHPASLAPLLLVALLAAGCAHNTVQRDATGNPVMARMSPEELARANPPAARPMVADDLVRLSRTTPPEELIKIYQQSGTRLRLTEAQARDLRARGVDQRVIEHVLAAEAEAQRTDRITAEVDRQAAARRRAEQGTYAYPGYGPAYAPHLYPYGGYSRGPWGSGWSTGVGIGF
jgi:hypothetical protein